jgi:WG containing repeat
LNQRSTKIIAYFDLIFKSNSMNNRTYPLIIFILCVRTFWVVPAAAQGRDSLAGNIPADLRQEGIMIGAKPVSPPPPKKMIDGMDYQVFQSSADNVFSVVVVGPTYFPKYYTIIRREDQSVITTTKFEAVNSISSPKRDLVAVELQNRWGIVDMQAKYRVPCVYESLTQFRSRYEFFIVTRDHKYGIIDADNNSVIPLEYDHIEQGYFTGKPEIIVVRKGTQEGLIDVATREVIGQLDDWRIKSISLYTMVEKGGRYNLLAASGQPVFAQWYDRLDSYLANKFTAHLGDKTGIIDGNGATIIPLEYDWIQSQVNGLYFVRKNGKYGILDGKGNTLMACSYDSLHLIYGGIIALQGRKWGLLSSAGKEVYPPVYDDIYGIGGGYTLYKKDGHEGVTNPKGIFVLPVEYDRVDPNSIFSPFYLSHRKMHYSQPLFVVKNGKWGILNLDEHAPGEVVTILPLEYEELQPINDELVIVKRKGLYGVMAIQTRKLLIPCDYSAIKSFLDKLTLEGASRRVYTIKESMFDYQLVETL